MSDVLSKAVDILPLASRHPTPLVRATSIPLLKGAQLLFLQRFDDAPGLARATLTAHFRNVPSQNRTPYCSLRGSPKEISAVLWKDELIAIVPEF
jgi:hypothetical protein